MKEYVNFYENLKEAEFRLLHTVVLYDGEPYYVLAICDHRKDGIFRVYLDPVGVAVHHRYSVPYDWVPMDSSHPSRGEKMDQFMKDNPDCGLLRKQMNSPLFNRFRPFPLGMCNSEGRALYLERRPLRQSLQGLSEAMIDVMGVGLEVDKRFNRPSVLSKELKATILGEYPSFKECVEELPKSSNSSVAFHRNFALIKGHMNMLFLGYKTDTIGIVQKDGGLLLGEQFVHLIESIKDLNIFSYVNVKEL